jgi:hypothetical protein
MSIGVEFSWPTVMLPMVISLGTFDGEGTLAAERCAVATASGQFAYTRAGTPVYRSAGPAVHSG